MRDAIGMSSSGNPNTVFMFSRATELQPRESSYWGALGGYAHTVALQAEGEAKATVLELSLISLKQARDNEPLLAFWHYQLGDALLYAASYTGQVTVDEALASYQRALELWPRNAVIAGRLAVAYMVAQNWDSAALKLQQAAEYDPAWAQTAHLNVALTALEGQGAAAAEAVVARISDNPGELHVFASVATTGLTAFGLVEPMAAVMLPALEAQGDDWATVAVQGVLLALTGDAAQAASLLTGAIDSAPKDAAEWVQNTANYLAMVVPGLRDALTA